MAPAGFETKVAFVIDAERRASRDAMDRLLDGAPVRSDGKLTIKSLAEEAGVKRWILTHRHTDLQDEFRARVARQGADPEPVRKLKQRIDNIRQENERLRRDLRDAREICALLERHIAVDALEKLHPTDQSTSPGRRLRPVT